MSLPKVFTLTNGTDRAEQTVLTDKMLQNAESSQGLHGFLGIRQLKKKTYLLTYALTYYASPHSDQSLRCPHGETLLPC